jgi:hypothetical protein
MGGLRAMRVCHIAFAALAQLAGSVAFGQLEPTAEGIATVNGRPIHALAFSEALQVAVARMNLSAPHEPVEPRQEAIERLGSEVLRQLVEESLLREEAKRRGITVSAIEVHTRRLHEEAKFASEADFQDMLTRTGLTSAAFNRQLELTLLEKRVGAAISRERPTDDEVAAYFEAHGKEFAKGGSTDEALPEFAAVQAEVRARAAERKRKFGYLDWLRGALQRADVKVLVNEVDVPQLGAKTPVTWTPPVYDTAAPPDTGAAQP